MIEIEEKYEYKLDYIIFNDDELLIEKCPIEHFEYTIKWLKTRAKELQELLIIKKYLDKNYEKEEDD